METSYLAWNLMFRRGSIDCGHFGVSVWIFFILMIWFVSQNIYVEAYFYHMQLGSNGDLSWAPLQPLGSWYNPVLFKISGNPITFQSQSSWVIMTPIVYCLSIYFYKKGLKDNSD